MKISLATLRKAANVLFDHLESGHTEIEIDKDYYWVIAPDERYAPYPEPKTFMMGQLSDDMQETERIANGSGTPIAFALVWLSAILRRVGEQVVG